MVGSNNFSVTRNSTKISRFPFKNSLYSLKLMFLTQRRWGRIFVKYMLRENLSEKERGTESWQFLKKSGR